MAQDYKFGTFAGVFTPSILTILGVIMYMRLGLVVGHAGMLGAIGIILIAHVVSIPTGLSVSSIATDRKVKAGGVYYIISRSLGLSIGGALGIALYVGMSFSIALYIIGFCENFNEFIGIGVTPNTLRIVGTLVLIAVTTLAFISTSLAIKAQFFILTAIALSLVSILFGSHDLQGSVDYLPFTGNSQESGRSLAELFGIYFPAVTGFTAGVSMSGDLKDPRRSIPVGTMAAIGVGLVVYLGLAVFLGITVDGESLRTDRNIMLRIAWIAPFVTAGIWAATISSALGSILGAPRILQALSVDKITPRFFGKGFGPANEPRNALLFTALLAEMAIMIGELDVVARIVSMFYMTTYGFLNLTCALESWASPDFRPDFKIPNWISVIGALASFILMIQLDLLAMIGATVIMIGIFVYLKRRELGTEADDAWDGVWASVVRMGLFKLNQKHVRKRNWRPNVILFSGGTKARPHLIDFGRWLVGNRGLLSNFELVENYNADVIFPKAKQSLPGSDRFPGIFTRRQSCSTIYEGMEMIVRSYGFSGMEPNTVMTGWARQTRDPLRFAEIVKVMSDLDYNILMLDYDERVGFGAKKRIDIWWRGAGNNVSLALMLVKFILMADEWRQATVRVLIMNPDVIQTDKINHNMRRVLDDIRIAADVKVIDNSVEQRSFLEIIRTESREADLTLIGLPEVTEDNADAFVSSMNGLLKEIGTVLLTRASSYFEEIYVGIERKIPALESDSEALQQGEQGLPSLRLPQTETLVKPIERLSHQLNQSAIRFTEEYMRSVYEINERLLQAIRNLVFQHFDRMEQMVPAANPGRLRRTISQFLEALLSHARRMFDVFEKDELILQQEMIEQGSEWLLRELRQLVEKGPQSVIVHFEGDQLISDGREPLSLVYFKLRKRLYTRIMRKSASYRVPFRDIQQYFLEMEGGQVTLKMLQQIGQQSYQYMVDLHKILSTVSNSLHRIDNRVERGQVTPGLIAEERDRIATMMDELHATYHDGFRHHRNKLKHDFRRVVQSLSDAIEQPEIYEKFRQYRRLMDELPVQYELLAQIPGYWSRNQSLLIHFVKIGIGVMTVQNRLRQIVRRLKAELRLTLQQDVEAYFEQAENRLQPPSAESQSASSDTRIRPLSDTKPNFDENQLIQSLLGDVHAILPTLPESVAVLGEDALNRLHEMQFQAELDIQKIPVRHRVEYILKSEFVGNLQDVIIKIGLSAQKTRTTLQEIIRLTAFNLATPDADEQANPPEPAPVLDAQRTFDQARQRIDAEKSRFLEIETELMGEIDRILHEMSNHLNPHHLIRMTLTDARTQSPSTQTAEIPDSILPTASTLSRIWNRWRDPLAAHLEPRYTLVNRFLTQLETVTPDPEIISQLPFYYRQLFLEKTHMTTEFWVGRQDELERAKLAIQRFRSGHGGALMITGPANAGKTSLAVHLAGLFFDRKNIYRIEPPPDGTTQLDQFIEAIEENLNASGRYNDIFNTLPPETVLIIDDLELWWEQTTQGQAIIQEIMRLINTFGHRIMIITTVNRHSLARIDRLTPIRHNFLDTIACQPLSVNQLHQLIMRRHRTSGLKIRIKHQTEPHISPRRLVAWFRRLATHTGAYPGNALQSWLAAIESINQNILQMKQPPRIDPRHFSHLEQHWIQPLIHTIVHKRMTHQRLTRLMKGNPVAARQLLTQLKRTGLLIDQGHGIHTINPYIHYHLVSYLEQNKYLVS